jgi:GT2 family glycosyltransferase
MHARVTAVLVARNGAPYLQRTVAAIIAQSRRPDALVAVDVASSDDTAAMLAAANPTVFTTASSARTIGAAVSHAVRAMPAPTDVDEWIWILAHDNAPQPGALAALLGAVEVAPSVAVAGPKLMREDAPDTIAAFGESMTPGGTSMQLVTNELDQAQHDRRSDLLAVAANGMLVRRRVWTALGGFDPGLPSVDAALDFCVRARLAGHRVIAVPDARVSSDGGPETFERRSVAPRILARVRRSAQLHRRLVYAPGAALVLQWLTLLPLAIGRSAVHIAAKRPWAVSGELRAALGAVFDTSVTSARTNFARTRTLGWSAIAPLRIERADARELESRAVTPPTSESPELLVPRPSFFSAGGAWIVLLLALVGAIALAPLFGATALAGGGLLPLSSSISELWQHTQWGWHDTGAGYLGPADPFALVLAVLGTLTFWSPSLAVVGLWFCAIPLAGLAAWSCAARFSSRGWAPAIAAIVWALAPPFLASLGDGHIGAVLVHVLLPWLVLAGVGAVRSWSAAGTASLLFAVIGASAPSLVAALLILWFAWLVSHPRAIGRMVWIVVPLAAVFAPLVWFHAGRGSLISLLADPGLQFASVPVSTLQLATGSVSAELDGWPRLAEAIGLPGLAGVVIALCLFAPLAVLALLGLFLPGSRRSIPAIVVAVLGFVTAVASVHLELTHLGPVTITNWAGPGLSLYWLGLGGAIVFTLESLGSAIAVPALIAGLAATGLAVPGVAAVIRADVAVTVSDGRMLPAFVTAQAATNPGVGTMQLTAQTDGSLLVVLHRGPGTSLDEVATVTATSTAVAADSQELADLAGNLAAASGLDVAPSMQDLSIGFVLLTDTPKGGDVGATRTRAADALDSNGSLVAIGSTDQGYLWQYVGLTSTEVQRDDGGPTAVAISAGTGLIALIALLLAIPTEIRRRPVAASGLENPADTFEEDESA